MKKDAFAGFHPAVNLAYFAAVLGLTMFFQHPVYLLISLLGACAYLWYLQGGRRLGQQLGVLLPVVLGMALLNPVFNREGSTVLFYLFGKDRVTLEAICFGLMAAVMMGASILWFGCCNCVFTTDKITCLFGRVAPSMSLMISMTLRFVPRFQGYLSETLRVQQGMRAPRNNRERLTQAISAFSATVSWAMEQSIVTADSMKSRGHGSASPTSYTIYRFDRRDGAALAVLVLLSFGAAVPWFAGWTGWAFYPVMTGQLLGPVQLFAYLCFCGLCLMPLMIDLREDTRWNLLRSAI